MRSLIVFLLFVSMQSFASDTTKLYDPYANVEKDVAAALVKAKAQKKHVLLQIGGNWCSWCYRYHGLVDQDTTLERLTDENYIVYNLNYSKENKNLDYLKKLGYPQRFGFPVFVILDADGKQLHTQDSALLEEGKGYSKEKVKTFLENWSPAALDEKNYKE